MCVICILDSTNRLRLTLCLPDFKVFIKLKKKSMADGNFKRKKEVDQCIMIVQKILWKQSDHQEVFSRQKIVLMKKGKKCLSLSVQCSFLGNVWMAFKHRNRRRPCYNSYTKVTLIFHAILVVSVKFLLQFLIKVWHLIW